MKNQMKKISYFLILFMLIAGSCKKHVPVASTGVTPAEATDSLYNIMELYYYWYNLMPTVNEEDYSDPYSLLEAMRYKTLDKWSFVADYDEFNNEMAGGFVGHGIRIGLDQDSVARIAMIYNNSPLYASGVRRGWIIKQLNGVDLAPVLLANDTATYNRLIGPSTAGIRNTFLFEKPSGSDTSITTAKASFMVNSVLLYDTLNLKTGVAGHLVFDSFITPSEEELATAFIYFKSMNINELILDLRYNSGGYLYIAEELASYIAGNGPTGTTFLQLTYNNKLQAYNETVPYITTSYPMSIPKLVVITTRLTASASESVMNGLIPVMPVISIGDTTDGKPVGMNGWSCGDKYWFWPITFKIVNSAGNGDYFSGIAPEKEAIDDITHDFSDRNEQCLNEAISYLETGSFSKGAVNFTRSARFGEKPAWMNNAFMTNKK
jgi:hypothetical protein